ncbi:MAG: molybdenum cofactor biosynthesis protein MoaE [Bacteroidetes bacterium SB0662_bin_6]|nr:molybdenum cofactor biosynthesis protein MoaE [Bacteroidetes bacterium SB0668_bin_1]MYE04942.1 molybdenum cofactor biosynthesis protein MoaE [Bacteroidetes bacterium SB0662_bin_6]
MTGISNDSAWINIQETPLSLEEVLEFLRVEEAGGIDIFLGTTRRWTEAEEKTTGEETDRRETILLEYECYKPMALKEMHRLVEESLARWPVRRACLLHRIGEVPLREISVIAGVAAPHRADAFAACRYLIDTLKIRVPIWKKEHFVDGNARWVEGDSAPEPLSSPDTM